MSFTTKSRMCKFDYTHKWVRQSSTFGGGGLSYSESCAWCDAKRQRPATQVELEKYQAEDEASEHMFDAWHTICGTIYSDGKLVTEGYALIELIERSLNIWKKIEPGIEMIWVDDDMSMNSIVLIVPHKKKLLKHRPWGSSQQHPYWGTTFLVVSQNAGQPPVEFNVDSDRLQVMTAALIKQRAECNKLNRKGEDRIKGFLKKVKEAGSYKNYSDKKYPKPTK